MAIEQAASSIATAAASQGLDGGRPGGQSGGGPGGGPDAFQPYIQQAADGQGAVAQRPSAQAVQDIQRPQLNTLGNNVLDSLERFGSRADSLRKLGGQWRAGVPAGGSGAGASVGLPASPWGAGALAGPAQLMPPPGTPPAPQLAASGDHSMDSITQMYRDTFNESMSHQAELYNLIVEVDLGRQVSSTATSTAKTLLTQSG